MKYIVSIILAAVLIFSAACESETPAGECIGAFDDQDPTLNYRASGRNIVLAVIFSETIIIPILVVASEVKCPTSKKEK